MLGKIIMDYWHWALNMPLSVGLPYEVVDELHSHEFSLSSLLMIASDVGGIMGLVITYVLPC